jgi:hypothetical protein
MGFRQAAMPKGRRFSYEKTGAATTWQFREPTEQKGI